MNMRCAFALRLFLLSVGTVLFLLGTSRTATAQQPETYVLFDDECFDLGITGDPCEVEGISEITALDPVSQQFDSDVNEGLDPELSFDYDAVLQGAVYENTNQIDGCGPVDDFGAGYVECDFSDSYVWNDNYNVFGDSGIVDVFGDVTDAGLSLAFFFTTSPTVTNTSPTFGYVGTQGIITFDGSFLSDPFGQQPFAVNQSNGNTVGTTLNPVYASPDGTQDVVQYDISTCAGTGPRLINILTSFGSNNSDQQFTVGDPTPTVLSVSPNPWQAGMTNVAVTINGFGFGDNPTLTILGTGITYTTGGRGDTQINATISVASNAPNQVATVQVQSNGYCGSGFQPANNNSSTGTTGVQVQASAPLPQISLYNQTITSQPVSVVVGQEINLSATIPGGITPITQQWTISDGTYVGGYNASTSGGCFVLMEGQASQQGACTGNPNTMTSDTIQFYWVKPGSTNTVTVQYYYTSANGPNSATVTFQIDAPSGVTVGPCSYSGCPLNQSQIQMPANVYPPGSLASKYDPILGDGDILQNLTPVVLGIDPLASSPQTDPNTYLPQGGQYQWVQLISKDIVKGITPQTPAAQQTCTAVSQSSPPVLDNTYPYRFQTQTFVTNDGMNDSPATVLHSFNGEVARSFSAITYLMWVPPVLNGPNGTACGNGNLCTIPVPLGHLQWSWWGDAIDTLQQDPSVQPPLPIWMKPDVSSGGDPTFAPDNSFPTWTATSSNFNISQSCPWI